MKMNRSVTGTNEALESVDYEIARKPFYVLMSHFPSRPNPVAVQGPGQASGCQERWPASAQLQRQDRQLHQPVHA